MRPTLALLALPLFALPAQATLTVYADRAEWEAAVGPVVTEGFEGEALTVITSQGSFSAGRFSFEADATADFGAGIGQRDGNRYLFGGTGDGGDGASYNRLLLGRSVYAIALDVIFNYEYGFCARAAGGFECVNAGDAFSGWGWDDPPVFLGVVSDTPFSMVEFETSFSGYAVDDVSVPVPEPGTGLLLCCGLGALAMRRRS